jgi:hypothetical protein
MPVIPEALQPDSDTPQGKLGGRFNAKPNLPPLPTPQGSAATAIRSAIDDVFLNDAHTKQALSANLGKLAADSLTVRAEANRAFEKFTASKFDSEERAKPGYTEARAIPFTTLQTIADAGTKTLRNSSDNRTFRIQESKSFMAIVNTQNANGAVVGTVQLEDLLNFINNQIENRPAGRPSMSPCKAENDAEALLREIEGGNNSVAPPPDSEADQQQEGESDDREQEAQTFVSRQIGRFMEKTTAPEEQLRFDVPSRKDRAALQQALETFELRSGPSDVTSYHDFSSLQIAFQHVWTEVFDGKLAPLGKEIYYEYVKLKSSLGLEHQNGRTITTLDDLAGLLDEVRDLSKVAVDDTPGEISGSASSSGGSDSSVLDSAKNMIPANVVANATGSPVLGALVDPAGAVINAISQAFAGKPTLNWDDFESAGSAAHPLPLEGDRITVQFEADVAPPGQVHVVIANTKDTSWWKGIEFSEVASDGKIIDNKTVATDVGNKKGWNPSCTNKLELGTSQLRGGILEFQKEAPRVVGGWKTGFYLLTGLDQKLKDRMKVTFTWIKD